MDNKMTLEDLHKEQDTVYQSIGTPKEYKPGRSIVTSCYRQEITGTYILLSELKRLGFQYPPNIYTPHPLDILGLNV